MSAPQPMLCVSGPASGCAGSHASSAAPIQVILRYIGQGHYEAIVESSSKCLYCGPSPIARAWMLLTNRIGRNIRVAFRVAGDDVPFVVIDRNNCAEMPSKVPMK